MSSQLASVVDALPTRPAFSLIPSGCFIHDRSRTYRIKGLLPATGLALIYGEYGSGKSFFALDLVMSVAVGNDWQGQRTKQGRVVYVVAEGVANFIDRYEAYLLNHELEREHLSVSFVVEPPNLLTGDGDSLIRQIELGGGADLIVFDTLSQCMPGADENSSVAMTQIVSFAHRAVRKLNALVILVAHQGKNGQRGVRGHTALPAAADVIIHTKKEGAGNFCAELEKYKEGLAGAKYQFSLSNVEVGEDEDGETVSSAVVVYSDSETITLDKVRGKWQKEVMNQLKIAGDGVLEDELIEAIKNRLGPVKGEDRRRETIRQCLGGLEEKGSITRENERVCLNHIS